MSTGPFGELPQLPCNCRELRWIGDLGSDDQCVAVPRNYGGRYQRDDGEMLEIWEVAVQETRALLESW